VNYEDEIYNYVKTHPGVRTMDIINHLETRSSEHVVLAKVFMAVERLEDDGMVRTEVEMASGILGVPKQRKVIRVYPTGKYRTVEMPLNMRLSYV
jgi:hypothetical protein